MYKNLLLLVILTLILCPLACKKKSNPAAPAEQTPPPVVNTATRTGTPTATPTVCTDGSGFTCTFTMTSTVTDTPTVTLTPTITDTPTLSPTMTPTPLCAGAPTIALGGSVLGSNVGAPDNYNLDCGDGSAGDVLYKFTLPASMMVVLHTCSANTNFDTVLALLSSCSPYVEIDCSDDDGCANNESRIVAGLDAGTYYAVVDGYDEEGNFELFLEQFVPTATPTDTLSPTFTPSPTDTDTPDPSWSPTPTVTDTATPTVTYTPTETGTPTETFTPTVTQTPCSGMTTFGNLTTVNTGGASGGHTAAYQFTKPTGGTVVRMRFNISGTNPGMRVGIYNDAANKPGSLLTTNAAPVAVSEGWNTIDVVDVYLNAGTYWLAVASTSGYSYRINWNTVDDPTRMCLTATAFSSIMPPTFPASSPYTAWMACVAAENCP